MTEHSPRMDWPFPTENEQPWNETFLAMIRSMDASGYASREDRNLILSGGGSIAFDSGTGILSWDSAIEMLSPGTGFLSRIQPGSVVLADGQVMRGAITRAPGASTNISVEAASFAANNDNSIVFAIRRGNRIYWRNGVGIISGQVIVDLASGSNTFLAQAVDITGSVDDEISTFDVEIPVGGFCRAIEVGDKLTFCAYGYLRGSEVFGRKLTVRLYDMGDVGTPTGGTLLGSVDITEFAHQRVELGITTRGEGWPTTERMYEIRVLLVVGSGDDNAYLLKSYVTVQAGSEV